MGSLWLATRARPERRKIEDALVLALHSSEDGPPETSDIELEFFVEEVAPDYSVTAPLSAFLEVWLPRITGGGERAIVLALCNPQRALVARPSAVGATPLWLGLGDVDSWRAEDELSLVADEWRTV